MDQLSSLSRDTLHHAHLLIRDTNGVFEEICPYFENNLGIKTKGNADFVFEEFDKFLINDARRIFDLHLSKTSKSSIQIIVVSFNFITTEAQNALLKMLEEPTNRTHFFIIAPSKNLFLPTILSRVSIFELGNQNSKIGEQGRKFLKMTLKDRLKFVSDLAKDIRDENSSKQDALDLLSGIELSLRLEAASSKDLLIREKGLKEIIKTRKYINQNGSSVKILLENIALSV